MYRNHPAVYDNPALQLPSITDRSNSPPPYDASPSPSLRPISQIVHNMYNYYGSRVRREPRTIVATTPYRSQIKVLLDSLELNPSVLEQILQQLDTPPSSLDGWQITLEHIGVQAEMVPILLDIVACTLSTV